MAAPHNAATSDTLAPSAAVPVQWERYVGTWYDVASIPQPFTADCVGARAEYVIGPYERTASNGIAPTVLVRNTCYRADASQSTVDGTAQIVGPGRLYVQFPSQPPYGSANGTARTLGNYWVHAVGPEYGWAVVGAPDRSGAYILARGEALAQVQRWLPDALQVLQCLGYPLQALQQRNLAVYACAERYR